jgi:hypothetical protein
VLSPAELQQLESTLLPALERHHLRLLAHGLRTLQAIAGQRSGAVPPAAAIGTWAAGEPLIQSDPDFADAFLEQMQSVSRQLEIIAAASGRQPLELDLNDLVLWARQQADQRIRAREAASGPPPD